MINSRAIADLQPEVQDRCGLFIQACKDQGIDLILTSTYRDFEQQNALYAQGRTTPGKRVTKAKGGQSFHNFGVAFDVVPVVNGKAVWDDDTLWKTIGEIGESVGLEWGGRWEFVDKPHFQFTKERSLFDLNKEYPNGMWKR